MEKFKQYIKKFNSQDEECYIQLIPNVKAEEFLLENAPRLSCPDEVIEETFAFREWTLRKHFKMTEDGIVLTEFLPKVGWSSTHNVINAPLIHHLNESRWLKNSDQILDYVLLFLDEKADAYKYSIPAVHELLNFLKVTDNMDFLKDNIWKIERYLQTFESKHKLKNGLFYSIDNFDAMEYSISGTTENLEVLKGIRPTLNSYMYGDYKALEEMETYVGNLDKAKEYAKKAKELKENYNKRFWNGDFYKALHLQDEKLNGDVTYKDIIPSMDAKELIGYIPFAYGLAGGDKTECFKYLKDEKVFKAKTGMASADISHPRYLYPVWHECLWNGYVWPYATSQVITSMINVQKESNGNITSQDIYNAVKDYANQHYDYSSGKKVNFIDEMMHPNDYVWQSRAILKMFNFPPRKGGYERGKDYNHSTFIDLVIKGLIGVDERADTLTVNPNVKGIWKWFSLENFTFKKKTYNIYYDEDGTNLNKGKGLIIEKV